MWENGQPHLHLGVHVAVDGRQPVDGWQAAAPSGAGMEHPFLVFIECGQMRVVSRHLQLVSAEHTRTVSGSTQNNCESPPRDALRRSAPGRSLQVVFVQKRTPGAWNSPTAPCKMFRTNSQGLVSIFLSKLCCWSHVLLWALFIVGRKNLGGHTRPAYSCSALCRMWVCLCLVLVERNREKLSP